MQKYTLLYIILAGIVALSLALFHYFKNSKSMSKINMLFVFLRFISVFSVLLLLINPRFEKNTLSIEKPNLVIAIDNSSSIKYLNQEAKTIDFIDELSNNNNLKEKFNLDFYTFGESLKNTDSVTFSENQTNIYQAFNQLHQVYKQTVSPTILFTDGNQTYGNDYQFITNTYKQPIYPIIIGDTVMHSDLKIEQLNVNKYAYLKNKFPVETILVYNGEDYISSKFEVSNGNTIIYSEEMNFSKDTNSKVINFTLPANTIGVSNYKATIIPFENEKNTVNNSKNFAVEVINQKTKIAIVSDFIHPDIGALKKSIESNEQRSVEFLNSNEILNQINEFQLIIVYQPNNKFKQLFDILKSQNSSLFLIIGTKTDLDFLNSINTDFDLEITNQTEDYQAELNKNYSPFIVDDINFESFPPLESNYGNIIFSVPFETVLLKTLNGVSTNETLLATFEKNKRREAILFGENIWKWRAQSYINSKSFNEFDNFIGKLVQYLASNRQKSRLNIEYESFYNGSNNIIIKAEFFDKNYVFDTRETLNITVVDNISKESKTFPLILKGNNYQVDLSSLAPSAYTFTIKASNENLSKSGSFQILEYNVEQQFLSADVTKLKKIATNSNGSIYHIDKTENLVNVLLSDNRYKPIQKNNKNTIPLIDWKYLLIILSLSLGMEWFLRKYYGLI
ncbi:VWA domain-containing protein [Litoribaculum gwangyangense]|uniref:VWA domain-containing protein n=1 Tax=Litoribaculum gwangyangense TaxID=1130722 RepID=A0ABP9CD36_9FLAO